jgi:hypothetical protein
MGLEKLAVELIVKVENELGRELNNIEKIAWVAAAGRLAGTAFKAIRPMLPKATQRRAETWGKAISTSYQRSQTQGLKPYDTARRVLGAAARQDPVLTAGAVGTGGFVTGKLGEKVLTPNRQAPMAPVYASYRDIVLLEKVASEKEENAKDKWLYAGAGATAGLLLGIRNKAALNKLKDKELLEKTRHIRELGDNLAVKYKDFGAKKEEQFDSLFKDIPESHHRDKVKAITKDIDRLIREVGNNVPRGVNKNDVYQELNSLIDKAHNSGELTAGASDYLRKSVNQRFNVNSTSNYSANIGGALNAVRRNVLQQDHPKYVVTPTNKDVKIVTPDDIINSINTKF